MKIIAGLGNPGAKYAGTRHNVGFSVIDELAERYNIKVDTNKHKALIGKGIIDGEKVILVMPQTYMNLSGESIRAVLDFYKCTPDDLIVVYDDIDLDVGKLRIRERGSAGGHNGMKNIIQHVGSQDFVRVRVGVGHKPENEAEALFLERHRLGAETLHAAHRAVRPEKADDRRHARAHQRLCAQRRDRVGKAALSAAETDGWGGTQRAVYSSTSI